MCIKKDNTCDDSNIKKFKNKSKNTFYLERGH